MTAAGGARGRLAAELRGLGSGVGRRLAERDLAAAAATMTYYAAIAVVPWLLLAIWSTAWWSGADQAAARWTELRVLVPPDMGGRPSYDALVDAGTHLGLLAGLVVLFPASFYGEGLRRACLSLTPPSDPADPADPTDPAERSDPAERFTGWRGRLAMLALVVLVPAMAAIVLVVFGRLVPLSPEGGGGGALDLIVRIVVGFTVLWLTLALPLAWAFSAVAPGSLDVRVALVGGLVTSSFLAGFLHGFQLFLAIPIDVGLPFGGLGVVGGVVAVGLWLYVLHTVVLTGWVVTQVLDERVRVGPAPPSPREQEGQ